MTSGSFKAQRITISRYRAMAGLSLIELMIAVTLGLILTLGVTQIFLGTSKTYRLTDSAAHIQENIRFATSIMERDVRSAGGMGCLQDASDAIVYLNGTRVVNLGDGLVGWEARNTGIEDAFVATEAVGGNWTQGAAGPVFPADLAGVVANTDILIVNAFSTVNVIVDRASPGRLNSRAAVGGPTVATEIPQGQIVMAIDGSCRNGELFQKGNNANARSVTMAGVGGTPGNQPASGFTLPYEPAGPNDPPSSLATLTTTAYYIGQGTNNEPALFMRQLDATAAPVELVDGVESMQIVYGVDTNAAAGPDNYVTAEDVTDWSEVVSVRVSLLMRGDDRVTDTAEVRTFNMLGTQVSTQEDQRTRLLATKTISLRNRLK